jgi:hypothetical protein
MISEIKISNGFVQLLKSLFITNTNTNIIGIPYSSLCYCLPNDSQSIIPCIYLIYLGNVGRLRNKFNIDYNSYDEEDYVLKYGCTGNFKQRYVSHHINLGLAKSSLNLVSIGQISIHSNKFSAEKEIKTYCINNKLKFDTDKKAELIICSKEQLGNLIDKFSTISESYRESYNKK